ncbi:MAG: hypothetical protein ACJAY7_000989 [Pseudohongiellaceae bacterium]|jgi:hypothetical protein
MNNMRERAQRQFPIVLLTLISIIQALALELLWSKIIESKFLWSFDAAALVGWGMLSVSLMGILQIWVMYSTIVMGFTWRPSLRDSIIPFVLGIQQFMMVSIISPTFNVMWLYNLASIFLVGNWMVHITFRRARVNKENDLFFKSRSPATLKDFTWPFVVISVLVMFGMMFTALGGPNWVALLAIVFANVVLALQIISSRALWNAMMSSDTLQAAV